MTVRDVISNDKVYAIDSTATYLAKDCTFSEAELSAEVVQSFQDWSDSVTPNTRTYVWAVPGHAFELRFAHSL